MSMPSFPQNGANMTREEALTMIIASIAMEELALSHILNAEGEKLQYILGTLPGAGSRPCPQDVLAVNKSVAALVEAVTQNQMLLKNKLDQVLEFCPQPPPPAPCPPEPCPPPSPGPCPPAPCPPSCRPLCPPRPCLCPPPCPPPREKSLIQLTGQRERAAWNPGRRLPWRLRSRRGKEIGWDERLPAQIQLSSRRAYAVLYVLEVRAAPSAEGDGAILLKQSPSGAFAEAPPLYFSMEDLARGPRTLRAASVFHPPMNGGQEVGISLWLDAKAPLYVEQAAIDVIEL